MKKLFLTLLISAMSIAFGQETGKTTFFATPEACLAAPADQVNIYQPVFMDHLAVWQEMVHEGKAELVTDGVQYCAEEWSVEGKVAGWHIIRWPENNPHFKDPTTGQIRDGRCGNKVRHLWRIPPPPVVPPGKVHFHKEVFNTEGVAMMVPTGVFTVLVGDQEVVPDANGDGEVQLPVGTYKISERFDEEVWQQIYLSMSEVTVKAGKTVNVVIKNQQRRPSPVPVSHVCPTCGQVIGSVDLDHVVLTPDLKLNIAVQWPGVKVLGIFWQQQQVASGGTATLTAAHFSRPGVYDMEVHGEDSEGHTIVCAFSIHVFSPPAAPVVKPHKGHGKLIAGIVTGVVIGVCIASYAEGWPVPCGWLKHMAKKGTKVTVPVYTP